MSARRALRQAGTERYLKNLVASPFNMICP